MRLSFLTCVLLVQGFAAGATITLTGTVVDSVSNGGIAATVVISGSCGEKSAPKPFGETLQTDLKGSFKLDLPGACDLYFYPKADGYTPVEQVTDLRVKANSGPVTIAIPLLRYAAISGRVIDWETDEPVANIKVRARNVRYLRGQRVLVPSWNATAATDSKGNFAIEKLASGEYVLEANFESFEEDDKTKRPHENYGRTFWPGPGDQEGASPLPVAPGVNFDAGNLRIRKTTLPSLTVKVVDGNCVAGQSYDVELREFGLNYVFHLATLHAPCGGTAELPHANSGEFLLGVYAKWQPEGSREEGQVRVEILDRDVTAEVTVAPPLKVHGTVSIYRPDDSSDHAPPDFPQGAQVQLWPRGSKAVVLFTPFSAPNESDIDARGQFDSPLYPPPGGEIVANLYGVPKNFYVKEIHYNGITSPGDVFVINAQAAQQEVQIVCSDKAGAIAGTVRTEDGSAVANDVVLITPWPADLVSNYPNDVDETNSDGSGAFTFSRLRPGPYRLVAVAATLRKSLEEPGKLIALFEGAESVDVGEAAAAMKNLTPVSPR
jgi:hypothetical protein